MDWVGWLMLFWFALVSWTIYVLIKEQNKGDKQMTKICDWDDCNEEVADWQTHCPKHYAMMQQQKEQSGMAQPEQQAQVQQPAPAEQPPAQPVQEEVIDVQEPEPQPVKQPEQPKPAETKPEPTVQPLPKLSDRERLIVKQTAFKGAIELMTRMNFEAKQFQELIDEVETLTVKFYGLIVRENEQ